MLGSGSALVSTVFDRSLRISKTQHSLHHHSINQSMKKLMMHHMSVKNELQLGKKTIISVGKKYSQKSA